MLLELRNELIVCSNTFAQATKRMGFAEKDVQTNPKFSMKSNKGFIRKYVPPDHEICKFF